MNAFIEACNQPVSHRFRYDFERIIRQHLPHDNDNAPYSFLSQLHKAAEEHADSLLPALPANAHTGLDVINTLWDEVDPRRD
jgi:hypothetical protein